MIRPMLATLTDRPFDDPGWIYEVKWDGYRIIAEIKKGRVTLWSRNGINVTSKYEPVVKALGDIETDCVLDGELVALDEAGRSRFQLLQEYGQKPAPLVYYVFDLLHFKKEDLRDLPLMDRKEKLKEILKTNRIVRYSEHIEERGIKYFAAAKKHRLEGVIAKRKDSRYYSGKRSDAWLKIKAEQNQEAVIVGFTAPKGSRKYIGALVMAVRAKKGWKYVGRAGGIGGARLKELYVKLKPLVSKKVLTGRVPGEGEITWVAPKLVGEVRFTEWTTAGEMRHPIFLALRGDKTPKEVTYEKEKKVPKGTSGAPKSELKLSNLEKVYFPKGKITKGDVIAFYERMADYILPYLADRPFVMNRHPNGITKPGFYQKDVDPKQLPSFVKTAKIYSKSNGKGLHYIVCNNKETLLYLANLGCIEMNPWNSRIGNIHKPDWYVIDLDPGNNTFEQVIEVAKVVKNVLDASCEKSCVKTSGKTGIHIYVPLGGRYEYERVRQFAELVANVVHERIPEITSVERNPKRRKKLIYVDFLQNRIGQTLAAPYSLRPVEGANVSTPLEWSEIRKGLRPEKFTIKNIERRLKKKGDLWKNLLKESVNLSAAIKHLERELTK